MKNHFLISLFFIISIIPFSASAQNSGSGLYIVAEAGTIQNSMALSGDLAVLTSQDNSAGSFGVAIGYRALVSDNFIFGLEGNIASSSANSSVADGFDTVSFDENMVAGVYFTGGFAFGEQNQALIYALLGVGSVSADTTLEGVFFGSETIDDKGEGISFGGAFEYGFADNLGIRVKVLHTRYKGEIDELKIRDTSIMGGLVYGF